MHFHLFSFQEIICAKAIILESIFIGCLGHHCTSQNEYLPSNLHINCHRKPFCVHTLGTVDTGVSLQKISVNLTIFIESLWVRSSRIRSSFAPLYHLPRVRLKHDRKKIEFQELISSFIWQHKKTMGCHR